MRQKTQGAAAFECVEDGIEDLPSAANFWSTPSLRCGKAGIQVTPFRVGKISGVRLTHA